MKKVIVTIVALLLFVNISQAQNKMHFNIGGNVLLPTVSFSDRAGAGFGLTVQLEMQFTPQLFGTATSGYITWGDKNFGGFSYASSSIPILFGAKYYYMPIEGFYGQAQLGLCMFTTDVTIPSSVSNLSDDLSRSSSEFAFALGAGYELPLSPKLLLDLSGVYIIISDFAHIGLRAGVKFGL